VRYPCTGADPDAVNEYSNTAMHYAGMRGWTPVIDTLANAGANVPPYTSDPTPCIMYLRQS